MMSQLSPLARDLRGKTRPRLLRPLIGTLLLVLTGCRIPSLCCPDPGPVMPEYFNGVNSSESSAQFGIYEFFNDPKLTQLLTSGLAQNQELKIRNQEIQIASNEILARRGAYLPFVSARARGGFEKTSRFTPLGAAEDQLTYPGGGRFPDPLPNVGLFANLFWRIDIWREMRNERDAAIQRYNAAIEDRNYLVTRLVAETAENYYELASLDKRLEFLNQTIELQQRSLEVAEAQKAAARGTELAVQRFVAEVRSNESQRLIVAQRMIEVENRINFLVGRYPQPVDRSPWDRIDLDGSLLSVGVPAQLLQNRRDIQAAERELAATGLDVLAARARFYPRLDLSAEVGYEAFNTRYLFDPEAFVANAAGELVAPLINRKAIEADYLNANARQLQAVYDYQRTILNAFTEVVNGMAKVQNYGRSVEIKQAQVRALEESVNVASNMWQLAHPDVEYMDVLFAQRDLLEARTVLIETKQQQLSAIVNAYRALGGGYLVTSTGMEFAELFCLPAELQTYEEISPPAPGEASELPPANGENVPTPANGLPPATTSGAESAAPVPVDVRL